VRGLDEAAMDPALVPRLRAVRVRLALAHGDLDAASAGIGSRSAPELRAALADTALGVGRTAIERHACARALAAYRQALDVDAGRTARAAAAAGLVRAALGCENPDATMIGLGVLAESMHPLLRRAATVIATTQQREQATPVSDRRGG